jgi:opine dehydrogenase
MAGHLAILGYPVSIYTRSRERIENIQERGVIEVQGEVVGDGFVERATNDIKEAVEDADIIMVVVPAVGHRFMAEQSAPHLRSGQVVILNPGRTFGAIEFRQVLSEKNRDADVTIAEAQTLLYVSRQLDFTRAKILAIKNHVPVAAIPTERTAEVLGVITKVFPQFVAARSVLETSMDNIGAVFHPAITIFNAGRIESHANFEFYVEGVTPSLGKAIEAVDEERLGVAQALGIHSHTAREWLRSAYNSTGENLYEAIQATAGYRGVKAPESLMHRYLHEDIPTGLVPMSSLGDLLNVPTPSMNALTDLACALHGIDYRKEGRTVEHLGLSRMNAQQIRSSVE